MFLWSYTFKNNRNMLVFFQNCSRKPILCATNMKHWLVESFGTIGSQTFFLHFLQQIGTNFILLARFFNIRVVILY